MNAKQRYVVIVMGHSEAVAPKYIVADAKHDNDTVCLCWDKEDAEMISGVLNNDSASAEAERGWAEY